MISAATPSATSSLLDGRLVIGYGGSEFDRFTRHAITATWQGSAARARGRDRALRDRLRSHVLFVARARRAACSSRARPSDATCWWRASPRREAPTSSRGAWPMPSRSASSSRRSRSRRRARRSCSRSTTARAIRSRAGASRRSSSSSSPPATATISPGSAAAARRRRTAFRAARSASSGSAATRCRPPTRAISAIPASTASGCRRARGAREPYIYHFPDGNASLARLLVRSLLPDVAARRQHGRRGAGAVRLRQARPRRAECPHPARLDLRRRAQRRRHRARRLCARRHDAPRRGQACGARLLPHDDPAHHAGAAGAQRAALARNVKTPLVYTNVLVRNWHPWMRLGVHDISAPMSFHSRVKLDFPVSLGGYRHPARSGRTHVPASRPRSGRAQPGARRARRSSASARGSCSQ